MSKFGLFFLSLSVFLSSCTNIQENLNHETSEHDYIEIEDKRIDYQNLFLINNSDYYVYFYSPSCGHCNEIKNEIITYSLKLDNFYYVLFNTSIPVGTDVSATIGLSSLDGFQIKGTPSLVRIKNHVLIKNIAGTGKIKEALKIET